MMKMNAIREMGRSLGLSFKVGTTKIEAIRSIQLAEGNFDCFHRGSAACDQLQCLFREDCLQQKEIRH
ncbi:MAG: hypothetical protein ACLFRL_06945 [Desulfohalobiaceae bacterium]